MHSAPLALLSRSSAHVQTVTWIHTGSGCRWADIALGGQSKTPLIEDVRGYLQTGASITR